MKPPVPCLAHQRSVSGAEQLACPLAAACGHGRTESEEPVWLGKQSWMRQLCCQLHCEEFGTFRGSSSAVTIAAAFLLRGCGNSVFLSRRMAAEEAILKASGRLEQPLMPCCITVTYLFLTKLAVQT